MRVPRLFVPARLREGACVDLPGEVAEHLGCVLRLGPGADLLLFNGEGGEWQATIEMLERGRVRVRIGSHRPADREPPLDLILAQGISRGERMDYTLQKAVELGVSRIVPIASERSVVRLSAERDERRAERSCRRPASSPGARASPGSCRSRPWTSGCPVSCPGSSCSSSAKRARAGFPSSPRSFHHLVDRARRGLRRGGGGCRRAGRVPSATARPTGPAHRDRGGRGPERPAGAVGRSRLGVSRTAVASIACSEDMGLRPDSSRGPTALSVIFG